MIAWTGTVTAWLAVWQISRRLLPSLGTKRAALVGGALLLSPPVAYALLWDAHAVVFARELGAKRVIIPQRKAASTWCAFGAAAADVLHIFEHTEIMSTPVDASRINKLLSALEDKAQGVPIKNEHVHLLSGRTH